MTAARARRGCACACGRQAVRVEQVAQAARARSVMSPGLEARSLVLEAPLQGARADCEGAGDVAHRCGSGWKQFDKCGLDAIGGRGVAVEFAEPAAELGLEERPHRLVGGEEGSGGVGGGERDCLARSCFDFAAEVLAEGGGVGGRAGDGGANGPHLFSGSDAGQSDPEDEFRVREQGGRVGLRAPVEAQLDVVLFGGDREPHRSDEWLVGGDASGGDLESGAAERGEDRWAEGLDGDRLADADRQVTVAALLAERLPQRVVVGGRQLGPVAREEVGRQTGTAQNVRSGDAEVGEQQAQARVEQVPLAAVRGFELLLHDCLAESTVMTACRRLGG